MNENYFQNINSVEKAYILGFVFADGCHLPQRNRLSIKLNKKDSSILKFISQQILGKIRLYKGINKAHVIKSKFCPQTEYVGFDINNKRLSQHLLLQGVIPRKTSRALLPDINDKLFGAFLSGYFDGDGCITNWKNEKGLVRWKIKICCSTQFAKQLEARLLQRSILCKIYEQGNTKVLTTTNPSSIKNLYSLLYENKNLFHLKRKKDKFDDFLTHIKGVWGDQPPHKGRPKLLH